MAGRAERELMANRQRRHPPPAAAARLRWSLPAPQRLTGGGAAQPERTEEQLRDSGDVWACGTLCAGAPPLLTATTPAAPPCRRGSRSPRPPYPCGPLGCQGMWMAMRQRRGQPLAAGSPQTRFRGKQRPLS